MGVAASVGVEHSPGPKADMESRVVSGVLDELDTPPPAPAAAPADCCSTLRMEGDTPAWYVGRPLFLVTRGSNVR